MDKISTIKLLVISPQCLESVNRAVYRLLVSRYNVDLHMVIPAHNVVNHGLKACSPVDSEPFASTLLEPVGTHPRLQRLKGLKDLIRTIRPSHIFVDADPATLLMRDVLQVKKNSPVFVCALTLENMDRNYLKESVKGLVKGKINIAIGGFITWVLSQTSKQKIDHIFAISQDGMSVMSRLGFTGRISKIPLGFDPALFYLQPHEKIDDTRRRLGLNSKTIAYFGRLVPEKGIDLLIRALSRLKDMQWQFMIDRFSDYESPYISELKKLINNLGIADRIVFFDATHNEMPDYMNAADIVVLPSITTPKFKEQYGRVIPEAMACGKIVIGSQSGTIPELIGDCGFVFPGGDVDALTKQLCYLLTAKNEELDLIRTKATHRAHTYFSITYQADIFAKMIRGNS